MANKPFNICWPVNVTGFVVTSPCSLPKAIKLPVKVKVPTKTLRTIEMTRNEFEKSAFKNSVVAGRQSYLSGRIEKFLFGKIRRRTILSTTSG